MTAIVEYLPLFAALLAAGAVAGFAAGLFGIGGGFVVVPVLMVILPLLDAQADQVTHLAVGTSLATIIFTSLRSVRSHHARGAVDVSILRGWGPCVAGGTVLGILIADHVSSDTLAVIFGFGALPFAVHFMLPQLHKKQLFSALPSGVLKSVVSAGIGLASSLLGIGGGVLVTTVMTLSGSPIHRAIGTASGMGAIIAVPGSLGFVLIGLSQPGLPFGSLGYVNLPVAMTLILTSVICAPLGVALAHRLNPKVLSVLFGLYLASVGVTIILSQ